MREDDAGFTLVELLVVITILTVVGGIVTATVVRSIQASHQAQQRSESLATLQNTLQRIGRELRAADPLVIEADTDVRKQVGADIYRGGEVHRAIFYIDAAGDLVEDREIRDVNGNLLSEVQGRLLASDVVVENVTFTYYDDVFDEDDTTAIGDPIDCADGNGGVPPNSTCLALFRGAEYVEIRVKTDLVRTADQEIVTLVNLRNERET